MPGGERIFLRQLQRCVAWARKGRSNTFHLVKDPFHSPRSARQTGPISKACARFSLTGLFLLVGFGIGFAEIGQEYVQHSVFVRFLHGSPFGDKGVPSQALLRGE